MLRRHAVIVLGAGASFEVDMPVGHGLKKLIAEKFAFEFEHSSRPTKGDQTLFDALTKFAPEYPRDVAEANALLEAGRQIRAGVIQAPSIDQFLDSHRGDTRMAICGKLAIAKCILECEKRSKLYIDPRTGRARLQFANLEKTWLPSLFHIIVDGATIEDVPQRLSQLTIISFNYDRCLKQYLFHALKNYYGTSDDAIAAALMNLRIIFPYGTIGPLEWESRREHVKFGAEVGGETLARVSRGLRTFTESFEDDDIL